MRNVWDLLEIGLLKMLFSTAAAEYMDDKKQRCLYVPIESCCQSRWTLQLILAWDTECYAAIQTQ